MEFRAVGRLLLCVFAGMISALTAAGASLTWTGAQSREWNTVHSNWVGGLVFQSDDVVRFPAGGNDDVFIGLDGVAGAVSPAAVFLEGANTFSGGDILSGGITNNGTALAFTNYSEGLSFPGGLAMRLPGNRLTYEVTRAPNLAQLGLGTGPIVFSPQCSLSVQVGHGKGIELANDLVFENQNTLTLEPFYQRTNGTVRFAGSAFMNGILRVDSSGGNFGRPSGTPGPFPDALAGRLVLSQEYPRQLLLDLNGWYGYRPFEISGAIVDGTGSASNRLEFQNYGMFAFRITGTNNTYRHGTYVRWSPSAPRAAIEVAPESSLGTGDVLVDGLLHLRGNRNIHSNANVRIQGGQVMIDQGVIVRVKTLQLGSQLHTSGRFTSNNAPSAILGAGEFRVGTNQPPTLTMIQPPSTVYAGTDIQYEAVPNDPDGLIKKVVFTFNENVLIYERTNTPWSVTLSNWGNNIWYSFAYAYDDDGAVVSRALQDVHVMQPPAPQLRNMRLVGTNSIFDFDALPGVKYRVEISRDVSGPQWQRLQLLQGSGTLSVTNRIIPNTSQRYYRIRAGQQ